MIDVQALKEQVNLLALAEQSTILKRVTSSNGGEWAGPCPFCGGKDRFHVQPYREGGGAWLCRGCSEGKWKDAIEYGQRLWPGLDFRQVCERLAGGLEINAYSQLDQKNRRGDLPAAAPASPAYSAPTEDWQAAANRAIAIGERNLWSGVGSRALDYLHRRGLKDGVIQHWRLGYSSGMRVHPQTPAPLSSGRGEKEADGGLYIPRGVILPCMEADQVWYLKIALLPGDPIRCQGCGETAPARQHCPRCGAANKYRGIKGNRTGAIYGVEELVTARLALFVEGEFDAMIAWQELNDVIAVCTLGSATNKPDLATWGPYLLPLEHILAAYDADRAGRSGLKMLQDLSERVEALHLPPGAKDLNEFYLSGGDLWAWLKGEMQRLGLAD
jgi:DNA primase